MMTIHETVDSLAATPSLAPRRAGPAHRSRWPLFGTGKPRRTLGISAVTAVALLALWFSVTRAELVTPLFLPPPADVVSQFFAVATDGFAGATLWEHTLASLLRVVVALGLVVITAIPIGLLMGVNRWFKGVFDPPIELYWPLPPLGYLPLIIIWFGIDEAAKILILFLSMFAPLVIATQAGVRSVPVQRVHAAYSLGASRAQVFWHVIARGALPEILVGLRIAIGCGWSTLVAAEFVAASRGLGFMIMSAARFLVTDVAIMGILVIAALAFAFMFTALALERLLVPWQGKV